MRIMKFGGTSLGSLEGFGRALDLVVRAREEERVVVVVSALSAVTSVLQEMTVEEGPPLEPWDGEAWGSVADPGPTDILEEFRRRHLRLWKGALADAGEVEAGVVACEVEARIETVVEELRVLRWVARAHGRWTPAARDRALGSGERLSALLMEGALRLRGLPARLLEAEKVIRTDSTFGQARVREAETETLARTVLDRVLDHEVPVVPGFSGADDRGRTTTLGRGSSDYTASILAAALSAREVEIWTDVEGVHRVDPRDCPDSPLMERLDYATARSLAMAGARVLHPRSLDPIERQGIPLRVRNTFNPAGPGTLVGPTGPHTGQGRSAAENGGARSGSPDSHQVGGSLPPVTGGGGPGVARLIIAGASGGVGSTLLAQLRALTPTIREETGADILVYGLLSSRGQAWFDGGCPAWDLPAWNPAAGGAPGRNSVVRKIRGADSLGVIFLDCTADPGVAKWYQDFLVRGIPVVTPNKLALSGSLREYETLLSLSRRADLKYETTVCAGLPVLGAVRGLRASGDGIREIRGVLSGTLSFVFHQLGRGVPFSRAVRDARDRGLAEPHPGEDLSGSDVARKLLILAREAGLALEPEDITVQSLVPPELAGEADPDRFLEGLEEHDAGWEKRILEMAPARPAYVASLRDGQGRVGVESLDESDPLDRLRPTENRVALETDRYRDVPMTISGPGAGREVTAAGIVTDLMEVLGISGAAEIRKVTSASRQRGRVA